MADAHHDDAERADLQPLLAIMATLRSPDGCPWDRKQTHSSLKRYLIEEAYELLDAIDRGDDDALVDELGDVLLQVIFHTRIATESGRFTMTDVIDALRAKLIRRHPHVFGDAEAKDAAAVTRLWAEVKRTETSPGDASAPDDSSLLADLPSSLPALMEAEQIQRRAARVGFEWDDMNGAWDKVTEELNELRAATDRLGDIRGASTSSGAAAHDDDAARTAVEEEFGDVLFALVNVARYIDVDPEQSLRAANKKFRRRFHHIETRAAQRGQDLAAMSLDDMDRLWNEAKQFER